jgi:Protein of unknown function (DUF3570)
MKNITLALASASALLLGPHAAQAQSTARTEKTQAPGPYQAAATPWQVDTGMLLYQEKDRVTAVKPVVAMSKDYGDEHVLNLKLVFDSLTGASPNGAAPANVPQSFTSPSGKTASRTPANGTPTVPGFKDSRGALSAGWSQPLSANTKGNIGGNFSHEYDYTSFGASLGLSQDLNQKNTTLSAGLLLQSDRINPVGGTPIPLGFVSGTQRQGNQTKNMSEWVLGLTQVINPKGFYQLSYSRADTRGYMNDPYKMLTLLDGSNQLIGKLGQSDTYTYLFESRPDKRSRNSVHNRVKYQLTPNLIADVSHRYTSDDWGIKSNTVDSRLRFDLAQKKYYVEPHLRYYKQSKANFYTPYLVQGQVPTYASSDTRLGAFDATTVGVKVGWNLAPGREAGLYLAQYKQNAADVAAPSSGPLAGQTMQAGLSAFVVQLSYRFTWK